MEQTNSININQNDLDKYLGVLENADSTLTQLMNALAELEIREWPRVVRVGISSSVTLDLLGTYLRKHGFLNGVKVELVYGNYDDPIGDIDLFKKAEVDQVVLLPFFDNLMPSFEARLEMLDRNTIEAKEVELRQRYRMVFENARSLPALYLGTFHRMGDRSSVSGHDNVDELLGKFNKALRDEASLFANIRLIDSEDIVRSVGKLASFDNRFYFRSKAPYTGAYINELAYRISAVSRGFGAYFYKVLALDCDNTLWGGVIGEDLLHGIKLNPHDYPGNIFWRMQNEFATMEKQGILLALVTKNNEEDIKEALRDHPDMVLKESHVVAIKANWKDKTTNLKALAKELNVGLESFIFLDDSSFECEAVRQQLPMVKTIQVPANIANYGGIVAKIKMYCLAGGISADSKGKTEQYRQRANAEEIKGQFSCQEDYLASLELKVEVSRNARANVGRISELSQKSNQFNLTTQRYSVSEVMQMMESNTHAVYSLVVSDKFGNAGLTGVVVMQYEGNAATVENFFMSCRVIGRGIETSIWQSIIDDAARRGCSEIKATYIPSVKNAQVADFYDRLEMPMLKSESNGAKHYASAIENFRKQDNFWVEVIYDK